MGIAVICGYFLLTAYGTHLFEKSTTPWVSFLGYNLVVWPMGLMLTLIFARHNPDIVTQAIAITAVVTVGMMCLGAIFPELFERISVVLVITLFLLLLVETIGYFVFGFRHEITDVIALAIFCGFIGFDWARANHLSVTIDNAIDSAGALYVDIINVFVRMLMILARKKND